MGIDRLKYKVKEYKTFQWNEPEISSNIGK